MSSTFNFHTPQPPQPHEKPDVVREADTLRALREAKQVLAGLIRALSVFSPQRVVSADGRIFECLARETGGGEVVVGDGATEQPFQIVNAGDADHPGRVRIVESTLGGDLPDGFHHLDADGNPLPFYLTVSAGDIIYGFVGADDDMNITSRTVAAGSSMPDDATDTPGGPFYFRIGSILSVEANGSVTAVNYRYGPIPTTIYRQWFFNPPQFAADNQ